MNKKLALDNVDFADSELDSFRFQDNNDLKIFIQSWDAKKLHLYFKNVIQFSYKLGFQIANFYERLDQNDMLDEALSRNYDKIPVNHPYKHFQLEDINDFPFIQIIAESVTAVKD